jgi:hypothetical protein
MALPAVALLQMESEVTVNQHGWCQLKVRLQSGVTAEELGKIMRESPVKIWETGLEGAARREGQMRADGEPVKPVFIGQMRDVKLQMEGGIWHAFVEVVTGSIGLDRTKRRYSFQDPTSSYQAIAGQVIARGVTAAPPSVAPILGDPTAEQEDRVAMGRIIWSMDGERRPGGPLIQYDETDWEFLIRLASQLGGRVIASERRGRADVYLGLPKDQAKASWDGTVMECGISARYHTDVTEREKKRADYTYYILSQRENRYVGELVGFMGEEWVIYHKRSVFSKGELLFYYTIGKATLFDRAIEYNDLFSGMVLSGEVTACEQERVQVRFAIDGADGLAGYYYEWKPVTGNLFYAMPEIGTKVRILIPEKDERAAFATSVIQTDGDVRFNNRQERMLEVVTGKTMRLFPEELSLSGTKEGGQPEMLLQDGRGVIFGAHRSFSIIAEGDITIEGGEVQCDSPRSIKLEASVSSLEVRQDFNVYSPGGVKNVKGPEKLQKWGKKRLPEKGEDTYTPCWQAQYAVLGMSPIQSEGRQEMNEVLQGGLGHMSKMAGGSVVKALSDAVDGVELKNNRFARSLKTLEIDTLNGGYPLPRDKKSD